MNPFESWANLLESNLGVLPELFVDAVAWTLLHFVWQAAILAVITMAVASAMRRRSAAARFRVYAGGLVAMALCVPVTWQWITSSHVAANPVTVAAGLESTTAAEAVEGPAVVSSELSSSRGLPAATAARAPSDHSRAATPTSTISTPSRQNLSNQNRRIDLATWGVTIYLFGVAAMLCRLGTGLFGSWRLRLQSEPADKNSMLLRLAKRASSELGVVRVPEVRVSQRLIAPALIGILRPVVMIPLALATSLSEEQLLLLIRHEIAHLRRLDPLFQVFQRLAESLFFFHPAVWVISRRISFEREQSCDDMAAMSDQDRLNYVDALLAIAERCERKLAAKRIVSLAADGGSPTQLARRVRRLLGAEPAAGHSFGAATLLIALAILCAGGMSTLLAAPRFALDDDRTPPEFPSVSAAAEIPLLPSDMQFVVTDDAKQSRHEMLARSLEKALSETTDPKERLALKKAIEVLRSRVRRPASPDSPKVAPGPQKEPIVNLEHKALRIVESGDEVRLLDVVLSKTPAPKDLAQLSDLYEPEGKKWKSRTSVLHVPIETGRQNESGWLEIPAGGKRYYVKYRQQGEDRRFGPLPGDAMEKFQIIERMILKLRSEYARDAMYRAGLMLRTGDAQMTQHAIRLLHEATSDRVPTSHRREYHRMVASYLKRFPQALASTGLAKELATAQKRAEELVASIPLDQYKTLEKDIALKAPTEIRESAWGESVNGLRMAVTVKESGANVGERFQFSLVLENTSDRAIHLSTSDIPQSARAVVRTTSGNQIATKVAWHSGAAPVERFLLGPGQRIQLSSGVSATVLEAEEDGQWHYGMTKIISPNPKQLRNQVFLVGFTLPIGNASSWTTDKVSGQQIRTMPARNDWTGTLTSGEVDIVAWTKKE